MDCTRCHRPLPEGSSFCNWCGKRQTGAPALPQRHRRRVKGTGTVYKRPTGGSQAWVARAGDRSIVGLFPTSAEAVNALDAYNALKTPADRRSYTLTDVYARWSAQHYKSLTEHGISSYQNAYSKAAPLHRQRIAALKTEDYQQIIDSMVASGAGRSLCEKQRQLFSQLCQYAIKQDIIDRNYAQFLVLPPAAEPKTRTLTREEIERISGCLSDARLGSAARIALVLIHTGMRINELLTMRRENVFPAAHYMVGGEKTKAGRDRTIPIHPRIQPIIADWLAGNETEWLLPSKTGNHRDISTVRKSFDSLMRHCGIQGVTPHTCRHTAATLMISAGLDPAAIKQILGHADFSTTVNRYTHSDTAYLCSQINLL